MKYIEQKSLDNGKTWTNTGKSFRNVKECDDHADDSTSNEKLDWRIGYYWVFLPNENGIQEHYQVVRS